MTYAPILCFGYDRPNHLKAMLNSLENNFLASKSDVTIAIDGKNKNTNSALHSETIEIAKLNWNFRSINVIEREINLGCRENIITSISEMFSKNEKLIIIEDDLILSKYFIKYMNEALEKYENEEQIWHINGYTYPQFVNKSRSASIGKYVSPWGWATWRKNWEIFLEKNYYEENFISKLNKKSIDQFNHNGLYDWENIILKHQEDKASIWDAYWYQAVFMENGLTIFPNKSMVQNNGFDGTGVHCSNINDWKTSLATKHIIKWPKKININLVHYCNSILFFKFYNYKRYLRYHRSKFSSFKNFYLFISKKLFGSKIS